MNETDLKHLKLCIENNVPEDSKGQVVYWKEDKTDSFEFKKVRGNLAEELSGIYIFEYDLYTLVKIPYDDIEHIILTELNSLEENDDKYDLRGLYDE